MDVAIWVALVGIAGTLVNAAYTRRVSAKVAERDRERTKAEEVEQLFRRYRDPLLRASFDLQSRMYNIIAQRFMETYHVDDRPDAQEYARENTLFVLAEFLGWVEILRREVRFLDVGVEARNRTWTEHLKDVRNALQSNRFDPVLQVLNGQQRAIGEVMIVPVESPHDGSPRLETMGYAAFVLKRRDDTDFARWFDRLGRDVALLSREPGRHTDPLVSLQRALIDLLDFLDPDCERLPKSERGKLAPAVQDPGESP